MFCRAFTNKEVDVIKRWARSLGQTTDNSASVPQYQHIQPYIDFLTPDRKQREVLLSASKYFDTAILPFDGTAAGRSIGTCNDWLKVAPDLFKQILEHPHGLRGFFGRDSRSFLRNIIDQSLPMQMPPDIVKDLLLSEQDEARTMSTQSKDMLASALLSSSALLEWMPAAGPAKLAGPLGMAVVSIQRSLLGFASPVEIEVAGCAGLDDVHEAHDGTVSGFTRTAMQRSMSQRRLANPGSLPAYDSGNSRASC